MLTSKECPQCGAPLNTKSNICEYCKARVFISSVSYLSNYDNSQIQKYIKYYKALIKVAPDDDKGYLGLGICYLQLSMFPFAKKNLETAIDIAPDNASAYYYYCLATIAGERIRFMSLDTIEEMLMYLNTAIGMEPRNQLYLLLMSMIKHDFYVLNSLSEKKPTYEELFAQLDVSQIEYEEIQRLKTCVKVSSFDKFGI